MIESRPAKTPPLPTPGDIGAAEAVHNHVAVAIAGETPNAILRTDGSGNGVAAAPTADVLTLLDAATRSDMRAAMDAVATPLTTRGDIWVRGASADTRLPLGGAGEVFGSDGTDPVFRSLDKFVPGAQVVTTDDAWTTAVTITTDAVTAVVETYFSVVGCKDDWSEGITWRGGCAHRRYGGTYVAMGDVAWQPPFSENPLLGVRVTEDANGVYIQVKGPAPGTNYRWQVKYLRNVLEN